MKRWAVNPWRWLGVPARIGWLVVGGYGIAALLIAASLIWGRDGAHAIQPLDEAVKVLCLLFAAACAGYAGRSARGRRRSGWLALLAALLGWAIGEVIWAVFDVRPEIEHAAHPAIADGVLLAYPVGAVVSLLLLAKGRERIPWRVLLDGVIVATSLFVLSWAFILDKLLRQASNARPATLTHVFADVALITAATLVFSQAPPGGRPSIRLLAGGIAVIGVADILLLFLTGFGTNHSGDLVDLARVAGLGMIALAGLSDVHEVPKAAASRLESWFPAVLWLPYVPLTLAAGIGWAHAVGLMQHGPLLVASGILLGAVLTRQFIVLMENQFLLSRVTREVFRDSLTGLANRAHFLDRLEQIVARQHHERAPIAVLCLDLDNFKSVNDALGHPAGDELLVKVARRLTAVLGDMGTVARLGGDEFAVVLEASVEESRAAAQRVLEAFSAAIVIDGVRITVRPSIGFTVATAASNSTVDELLRHADLAMYTAKREGGQCIRGFMLDLPFPYILPEFTESAVPAPERRAPVPAHRDGADIPRPARALGTGTTPALEPIAELDTPTPDRTPHVPEGVRWPPLAIRIALAALAIGVTVFTVASVAYPNAAHSPLFAGSLYSALNLSAAALIAIRACRFRADRWAWILIAGSIALSVIGEVVYVAWMSDGRPPSATDPAFLSSYPFVFAGLALLMHSRLKRMPTPIRLDSLVCGLTMAAVAAALTAGPIHAAAIRAPATAPMVRLYLTCDLILLALAAGMLPIFRWRNKSRWGLLIAGVVGFAVAGMAYFFQTGGSDRVGSVLSALWPASSFLVAMASWAPATSVVPLPRSGLGPYVKPVACTAVALGVAILGHNSRLAVTLAALTLLAVAARLAVTFRDVSMLAESHKHAMTDELTALPNRRSLATTLTELSGPAPAGSSPTIASSRRALLLLHLYDFHEINDSAGRQFGDELLCGIANRLANCIRHSEVLARVSDDEFAIVLAEGSDLIAARAQAGRLLEALSGPFALDPITVQVDARIAIALYPDHCDHPQELLNCAEAAILHAKSSISKIAVYDPVVEVYRDDDPNLIEELRGALFDRDQLVLHYQPKINASDGSVHSVEALLRWQHPRRGLLLPEEFLPAAERAGLIRKVASHTIDIVLKQIRSWRDEGISLTVAVNISATNLLDLELVSTIRRLLRTHGLPADALIVEITESALVDSTRSRNTVIALQHLGVRISLDDYGTGWSSLARLQDVSVDELKLDRIFVARLVHDPRSVAIVRSTVALAHSLGADLVAEGVEDEVTLSALRRYGCTITQGFVHSPPLPPDELHEWITGTLTHRA